MVEQFEDVREDALLFGVVFFDRKVQESEFSIDLKKHLRSDFPDLTGNEFGGVENGDDGFLDDFAQELNGDFIE